MLMFAHSTKLLARGDFQVFKLGQEPSGFFISVVVLTTFLRCSRRVCHFHVELQVFEKAHQSCIFFEN